MGLIFGRSFKDNVLEGERNACAQKWFLNTLCASEETRGISVLCMWWAYRKLQWKWDIIGWHSHCIWICWILSQTIRVIPPEARQSGCFKQKDEEGGKSRYSLCTCQWPPLAHFTSLPERSTKRNKKSCGPVVPIVLQQQVSSFYSGALTGTIGSVVRDVMPVDLKV